MKIFDMQYTLGLGLYCTVYILHFVGGYTVQCTLYTWLGVTLYNVHGTLGWGLHCTMYTWLGVILYSVHCTMYIQSNTIHCMIDIVNKLNYSMHATDERHWVNIFTLQQIKWMFTNHSLTWWQMCKETQWNMS